MYSSRIKMDLNWFCNQGLDRLQKVCSLNVEEEKTLKSIVNLWPADRTFDQWYNLSDQYRVYASESDETIQFFIEHNKDLKQYRIFKMPIFD
jgi:hypothetical protein